MVFEILFELFTMCSRTQSSEEKKKIEQHNMMSPILPVIDTIDLLSEDEFNLLTPLSEYEYFIPPTLENIHVE